MWRLPLRLPRLLHRRFAGGAEMGRHVHAVSSRPQHLYAQLVFGAHVSEEEQHVVRSSLRLVDQVVSEAEEASIVEFAHSLLRRRRFEQAHWDQVISAYRERQCAWNALPTGVRTVFERIRDCWLPACPHGLLPVHFLDLKPEGYIASHVDSVKFSGPLLAGLSTRSACIMRLRPETGPPHPARFVDLLLPARSLYIMTGTARYDWAHEISAYGAALGDPAWPLAVTGEALSRYSDSARFVHGDAALQQALAQAPARSDRFPFVPRQHRLSVLFRDALPPDAAALVPPHAVPLYGASDGSVGGDAERDTGADTATGKPGAAH